MVNEDTLEILNDLSVLPEALEEDPEQGAPACVDVGEKAVVHCSLFLLELPKARVKVKRWPGEPSEAVVKTWRKLQLPEEAGEPVISIQRGSVGETKLIRLQGKNGTIRFVQAPLYEVVKKACPAAQFVVYPGTRSDGKITAVGVEENGELIGVVAPLDPEK